MGMSEQEYFKFQLREQKKIVENAYRNDPTNTSYVFYGTYGKVVWTIESGGRWTYEVQPPRTKRG